MTYREMLTVQDVNMDWLYLVEESETLLRHCWERFFADADVKPLNECDTEEVGLILRLCCDRIWDAVLSYRLSVGEDGSGVEEYLQEAAKYQEARELNVLVSAAHEMERKRPGVFGAPVRAAVYDLPPAEAIRALRELLGDAAPKSPEAP